jgi:hypothetical protein
VQSPGKVEQHITDLSRKLRSVTDAERTQGGFAERRFMAHGPLSTCAQKRGREEYRPLAQEWSE